jgi:hypothetical protein
MQAVFQSLLTNTHLPSLSFSWPFFGRISLDGWFSLIWAFGALTTPHQIPRPGTFSSIPSSMAIRELVTRAHERMSSFAARYTQPSPELTTLISETPLIRLIRDSDHEMDRMAAMEVYRFINGDRGLESIIRRCRVSTQLSLFR